MNILIIKGALSAGEFQGIECSNFYVGKFVSIYFDHPGVLNVCEFEVYGSKFPS